MNNGDIERLRPLHGFVLCRVLQKAEKLTAGGIVIPRTAYGRPRLAEVLRTHSGIFHQKSGKTVYSQLWPGVQVHFDPYRVRAVLSEGQMAHAAGTPYAAPGEVFLIHEDDVQAVDYEDAPSAPELESALDVLQRAVSFRRGPIANATNDALNVLADALRPSQESSP